MTQIFTLLLWLLALYGLALFLSAFILSLFFWYEATNRPCPQIPPPPYKPLPVFQTCLRYFLFHAIRPAIAMAWLCMPQKASQKGIYPPVVLIHGIFSTRTSWYFFYKALVKKGFSPSAFGYVTLWGSMEATVARLEKHVQKIREKTGSSHVTILAHSLGGVVARYWLAKYPHNYDAVSGIITLCTPHGGSNISTLLPNPFARAVSPNSAVLQSIATQSYESFPCIAYATNADTLVVPAKGLVPPENWKLLITPPIDHLEILAHKKVISTVVNSLQEIQLSA